MRVMTDVIARTTNTMIRGNLGCGQEPMNKMIHRWAHGGCLGATGR